jgi:hypothetical protein
MALIPPVMIVSSLLIWDLRVFAEVFKLQQVMAKKLVLEGEVLRPFSSKKRDSKREV